LRIQQVATIRLGWLTERQVILLLLGGLFSTQF